MNFYGALLLIFLLLLQMPAVSQDATEQDYRKFVRDVLNLPTSFSASVIDSMLGTMGDRTAAEILRLAASGDFDLLEGSDEVLSVVARSFDNPQAIVRSEDRNPGVSLLLLKWIRFKQPEGKSEDKISALSKQLRELASRNGLEE